MAEKQTEPKPQWTYRINITRANATLSYGDSEVYRLECTTLQSTEKLCNALNRLSSLESENRELRNGLSEMLSLLPSNEIMKELQPDNGNKNIRKYGILNKDLPTQQQIENWRKLLNPKP